MAARLRHSPGWDKQPGERASGRGKGNDMNRHSYPPTDAAILKARVAAAIANNPGITARQLADLTGMPIGGAIAALEKRVTA